jgi:hypothetical protein
MLNLLQGAVSRDLVRQRHKTRRLQYTVQGTPTDERVQID